MKKLLQLFGAVIITATPAVAVVSCGTTDNGGGEKPPDKDAIKALIQSKVQPLISKLAIWQGTGGAGDIDLTGAEIDQQEPGFLSDLSNDYPVDNNEKAITNPHSLEKLNDYILKQVSEKLVQAVTSDAEIKDYFKNITKDNILKINTSKTNYQLKHFNWNPIDKNGDKTTKNFPDRDKGEWFTGDVFDKDPETSYFQWFKGEIGGFGPSDRLTNMFSITADVSFDVNYTIPAAKGETDTVTVKPASQNFFIINSAGKKELTKLRTDGSKSVTDVLKSSKLLVQPEATKQSLSFNITDNAADIHTELLKKLNDAFKPLASEHINFEGIDVQANDIDGNISYSGIGSDDYWKDASQQPNKYSFAPKYLNDDQVNSGPITAKDKYVDLAGKMKTELESHVKSFQSDMTKAQSVWSKSQYADFSWDQAGAGTIANQNTNIAYGMVKLTNWTMNGTQMPTWLIPYGVQFTDATVTNMTVADTTANIAATLFSSDHNVAFDAFSFNSYSIANYSFGRGLKVNVNQTKFNQYTAKGSKTDLSDVISDSVASVRASVAATDKDTWAGNVLKDMNFESNIPTLYDYNIATYANGIDIVNTTSTSTSHPSWGLIKAGAWPRLYFRVAGFNFFLSGQNNEAYIASGLQVK